MRINPYQLEILMARKIMSYDELMATANVTEQDITNARNGSTELSPKTVGLIAKALKVDPARLIDFPIDNITEDEKSGASETEESSNENESGKKKDKKVKDRKDRVFV